MPSMTANKNYSNEEYVGNYKNIAIQHMMAHKIPASITMAQAILESGSGNSPLAKKGNNHFGIKCHDWTGEKMYMDDDQKDDCFRVYATAEESYVDHSLFLTTKKRYASLFTLKSDDYKAWANGLKEAGYATNPKYAQMLIELIERMKLNELDQSNSLQSAPAVAKIKDKNEKENKSTLKTSRKALKHENRVLYIVAKKGDTYYRIAQEFEMGLWQLYAYNDFDDKKDCLKEGDIVYLQPKKAKGRQDFIVVEKAMSLNEIAQKEAVKVKKLMKRNHIENPNEIRQVGEKIILR